MDQTSTDSSSNQGDASLAQPKTRAEFLKYYLEISLDPNTAGTMLILSEGGRKATYTQEEQPYSHHPDRFTEGHQVLSKRSLTGRCYWEVEWSGGQANVAVAYNSISRTLTECFFGWNDKSWVLYSYKHSYVFCHNKSSSLVSGPWSTKVGVYLDHGTGVLSFYSVSETMTLLHTVETTFTQPLHAGLCLHGSYGATAEFIVLKCAGPKELSLAEDHGPSTDLSSTPRDELQPETRAEFLKYYHKITLDPNTADTQLILSKRNQKATYTQEEQLYSHHPDRFTDGCQVLSGEGLTGQCYWEVEWKGKEGGVCVAVAYKNISRTWSDCVFGWNDKSWALYCNKQSYTFRHNRVPSDVSGPRSSTMGVYLDHSAGAVSFYAVSDTMDLLHKVQTTFTQPLYAGLCFFGSYGATAEFIQPKYEEPKLVSQIEDHTDSPPQSETRPSMDASSIQADGVLQEIRADFLKYSCEITLDPKTADTQLMLSHGNRKATYTHEKQHYPHNPERFTDGCQVLSGDGLTGRCYWEVEWKCGRVCIAVAYKNISRSWSECVFGWNDKSWALYCNKQMYTFRHNKASSLVSGPRSSRVGVYLDHGAGFLAFYNVSETLTLLHRVKAKFTQPLYAGFCLYGSYGASAEFIKLKCTEMVQLSNNEALSQSLESDSSLSHLSPSTDTSSTLTDSSQPVNRDEFLKYYRKIRLDGDTAGANLVLTDGDRKATYTQEHQLSSHHPDRFSFDSQVLSKDILTGRCYWEVEWKEGGAVDIAVTYKNVSKTWSECIFGWNDTSWALYSNSQSFVFQHNNVSSDISGPPSSRIGVFLDCSAGVLSFYSVCETMTLLHTCQTTFTEPLHAGLCLYGSYGVSAEFVKLK